MSMKMEVKKATPEEIRKRNATSWPIWECGVSTFPWHYDDCETCYILEGQVTVKAADHSISFGPGDLVTFPKGLDCTWTVTQPVRKHYKFG